MSKQISLVPLYLRDMIREQQSFVKSIPAGTGLGKTYSSKQAFIEFCDHCQNKGMTTPQIAIFTAPQHNQITFSKEGFGEDIEFIKVRPISPEALTKPDSENNAYLIAKNLLVTPTGGKRQLFQQLVQAAKKVDAGTRRANPDNEKNHSHHEQTVYGIFKSIKIIDGEKGRSTTNEGETEAREFFTEDDLDHEAQLSEERVQRHMKEIAKALTNLARKSYTNEFLNRAIKECLSPQSFDEFREVTASFLPFLHIQASPGQSFFMCMTTAKMMMMHSAFYPRYIRKRKRAEWAVKEFPIDDILSDQGALQKAFDKAYEDAEADGVSLRDTLHAESPQAKLHDAQYTLYLDESDDAKAEITKQLKETLYDEELIQAIGSMIKETGDILVSDDHQFLSDEIAKAPEKSIAEVLADLQNDDSLHRILSKETLLMVRRKVYQALLDADWVYARPYKSVDDLLQAVNVFFRNTLTAPYCTVDKAVDADIFKSSSAFAGEMYGFIGSKNLDHLYVVNLGNSFRIIDASKKDTFAPEKVLPAPLFVLAISEGYLYLRSIYKSIGSETANEKEALREHEIVSLNDKHGLNKLIKQLQKQSGSFASISAPFRLDNLHTRASHGTGRQARRITERKFRQAFSDSHDIEGVLAPETVLRTPKEVPIDIPYAYEKGHTIYGMQEAFVEHYRLYDESGNVVFPVSIRIRAAEAFLKRLVNNERRINRIFLLSATGGFENNHIAAFSLTALRILFEDINARFIELSKEDLELVARKQDERGEAKTITVKELNDDAQQAFYKATWGVLYGLFKKDPDTEKCQDEDLKKRIMGNKYKRNELNQFLGALDHVNANNLDSVGEQSFSLALMQSQGNVTKTLKHLAKHETIAANGYKFSVEAFPIKQGAQSVEDLGEPGIQASAGIFVITQHPHATQSYSRFSRNSPTFRKTMVVCHSAQFEREATKLIREQDANPNSRSPSYRLKELLGLNTRGPVRGAHAADFNVMNCFLNEHHGMNVIIASSYVSAGRGINLIVNHESLKTIFPKKRGQKRAAQNELFAPQKQSTESPTSTAWVPRDLDALFLCAPPFYSHIRRPEDASENMNPKPVQARFFNRCEMYHHYLDFLARESHLNPEREPTLNTDVDLDSHISNPDAKPYFDRQHEISLLSTLLQGCGRIERTNFTQTQCIYACPEVTTVLNNGLDAIFEGHSDQQIEQMTGAMSVANAHVVRTLQTSPLSEDDQDLDKSWPIIHGLDQEALLQTFEDAKNLILSWIRDYRQTISEHPDMTPVFIEFYEALRSPLIWTHGQQAYIDNLHRKAEQLPSAIQSRMEAFIDDTLFFQSPSRIVSYEVGFKMVNGRSSYVFQAGGHSLDFQQLFSDKQTMSLELLTDPYEEKAADGYRYPTPWFLADINGNFGELIIHQALQLLVKSNPGVKLLDRHNNLQAANAYELADAFLVTRNQVLAIDAKCLSSTAYFVVENHAQKTRNEALEDTLERHLNDIRAIFPETHTKIVAINTFNDRRATGDLKRFGDDPDIYTLGVRHNAHAIARKLNTLLKGGH